MPVNNNALDRPLPHNINAKPVSIDLDNFPEHIQVIQSNLVNAANRYHHDSTLLAKCINTIILNKANS